MIRHSIKNEDLISPTFCLVPFAHEYYESDGQKKLCCKATSFVDGNLDWNGADMRHLRKEMLKGNKVKPCTACYSEEKVSKGLSYRQELLNKVKLTQPTLEQHITEITDKDGYVNKPPVVFHVTLGNLCTNQCNMCSPWNSSSLNHLHKQINNELGITYNKNWFNPDNYKWVNDESLWAQELNPKLHNIIALVISGGEPFIIERFNKILQYCVDNNLSNNIEIFVHTNTAQLPSPDLEFLFSKFKHVYIMASIDDINVRNEYIRYPTTWKQTKEFIQWCEDSPDNISIESYVTVQNLNIYYIPDIQDWWFNQNFKKINRDNGGIVHTDICHLPERNSNRILPLKAKKMVREKFERWFENLEYRCPSNDSMVIENSKWALERFKLILDDMDQDQPISPTLNKSNEEHYTDFMRWTTAQDKIRDANYLKVFPWLIF